MLCNTRVRERNLPNGKRGEIHSSRLESEKLNIFVYSILLSVQQLLFSLFRLFCSLGADYLEFILIILRGTIHTGRRSGVGQPWLAHRACVGG